MCLAKVKRSVIEAPHARVEGQGEDHRLEDPAAPPVRQRKPNEVSATEFDLHSFRTRSRRTVRRSR